MDFNACGGTHLQSTAEIQALKLVGVEKTKGMVRLRFLAGDRVIAALGHSLLQESMLNKVQCTVFAQHSSFTYSREIRTRQVLYIGSRRHFHGMFQCVKVYLSLCVRQCKAPGQEVAFWEKFWSSPVQGFANSFNSNAISQGWL